VYQDVMEIDPATVQLSAVSMSFEDDIAMHATGDAEFAGDADVSAIAADISLDDGLHETSFADQLLSALATMAMRSKRRQADLCAALCRGRLDTDPKRVTEALRHLERSGCIEHLVPLYDGGVLMSVTSRGIEKLSTGPRWNMLDGAGFLRG
jgi:hypothetical protein